MARLILLNGPPGIGKSTIARRADLATDEHPEHEVDDIRTAVREAIRRLRLVADERPATRTITASADVDVALTELAAVLLEP